MIDPSILVYATLALALLCFVMILITSALATKVGALERRLDRIDANEGRSAPRLSNHDPNVDLAYLERVSPPRRR